MRYSGKQFLGQSDFFMIKSGFPFFYSKVPDKQADRNKRSIKGQLNSEWIYEVNISPKMQTKFFKDFCPTKQTKIVALFFGDFLVIVGTVFGYDPCLFGGAEILVILGLHFGRNDDLIN